jgi:magnesium transporter
MNDARDNLARDLSTDFIEAHPRETAVVLEGLPARAAASLLSAVSAELAAPVLQNMAPLAGADCLVACSASHAGAILAALPLDEGVGLLRLLEPAVRVKILDKTPRAASNALTVLLQHPENTAGALMDPRVLALPEDLTVAEARKHMRRYARFLRYYLYVTGRDQKLVGALSLRELMLAPGNGTLNEIMHRPIERLAVSESREAILAHPGWRRFHALPVVDAAGSLAGVVRYETLRDLQANQDGSGTRDAASLAIALGELYWVGAASVTRHLLEALNPRPKTGPQEEGHDV